MRYVMKTFTIYVVILLAGLASLGILKQLIFHMQLWHRSSGDEFLSVLAIQLLMRQESFAELISLFDRLTGDRI